MIKHYNTINPIMRPVSVNKKDCSPAGLCSQDHIYCVHSHSHDIDDCLTGLSVCQAVDTQRLQGGSAALGKEMSKSATFKVKY